MTTTKNKSFFSTLKQNGPWGEFEPKSQKPRKPQGSQDFDDIEKLIKKFLSFIDSIFQGKGVNKDNNSNNFKNLGKKSILGVLLMVFILWLSLGFYKVKTGENAVVMYFGKFHSVTLPGLNWRLPSPIGKVIKKDVEKINQDSFGQENLEEDSGRWNNVKSNFKLNSSQKPNMSATSMLTGDENIVDVNFTVRWKIGDIKDFIFNVSNPEFAVIKAAESAIREVIATKPISDALSDGKQAIEEEAKKALQNIMDFYKAGIFINAVQLGKVEPPAEVIESFRDVQAAKADKEKKINQAKAYSNNIIPVSRGESAKIINQAEAYEKEVVAKAEGEAEKFNTIYKEYRKAKYITRERMKIEAMEKIYENMDKIIIDKNISSSGVVPYLPLNQLKKN
jgi:membrane protease subunit HflK